MLRSWAWLSSCSGTGDGLPRKLKSPHILDTNRFQLCPINLLMRLPKEVTLVADLAIVATMAVVMGVDLIGIDN